MMRWSWLLLVGVAVVSLPVLDASADDGVSPENTGWQSYEDATMGIRVSYPEPWRVIIARTRDGTEAAWSPEVLEANELHKITFREEAGTVWPGQYQVRVLANPDSLDLEVYYDGFDRTDLWADSAGDTTIAGRAAKTWIRWTHESLVREYLLLIPRGAVHILCDEHNSNDPSFPQHRDIYARITSSLEVTP